MNHLIFWCGVLFSALLLSNKWFKVGATCIVIFMLVASWQYWYRVYRANINYMLKVRIPAAKYVNAKCDSTQPIGTSDLGPLRYYAHQPILDLFGFVNKDIPNLRVDEKSFSNYLLERNVECLYVFAKVNGVGVDIVDLLNINDDSRYQLRQEANFAVPLDEWFVGTAAIGNYMPSISVLRVIPTVQ